MPYLFKVSDISGCCTDCTVYLSRRKLWSHTKVHPIIPLHMKRARPLSTIIDILSITPLKDKQSDNPANPKLCVL